jgi:hypothetical protein
MIHNLLVYSEDGSRTFLPNIDNNTSNYTASNLSHRVTEKCYNSRRLNISTIAQSTDAQHFENSRATKSFDYTQRYKTNKIL